MKSLEYIILGKLVNLHLTLQTHAIRLAPEKVSWHINRISYAIASLISKHVADKKRQR